jgi:hypothetical protein
LVARSKSDGILIRPEFNKAELVLRNRRLTEKMLVATDSKQVSFRKVKQRPGCPRGKEA